MARISKAQAANHKRAEDLIHSDRPLHEDECLFVLENWREDARHINGISGAFFTPPELAQSFAATTVGCGDASIVDLCAGIGALAWHLSGTWSKRDITCVELNPDYVEVGKRIVPNAEWLCMDVFDVTELGQHFDWAVSNPPFGTIATDGRRSPRYTGGRFEYSVMDIASHVADFGAFIAPASSFPFRASGRHGAIHEPDQRHRDFVSQTGIRLGWSSVDCEFAKKLWRGVSPNVEIGVCDFTEAEATRQAFISPTERRVAS